MKYPKIQTLWKREEAANKGKIIVGQYSLEEFGLIKRWQVQEKIDGTNIRIHYHMFKGSPLVEFHGRTDEASIPPKLLAYLQSYFTHERLYSVFDVFANPSIMLFGEGYGPKIQNGGNYRSDPGFILFDIAVGDWWLKQEDVKGTAASLNIPYAPMIGMMTEEEIVEYVKSKPLSLCSEKPQVMEGIIARTEPLLLLRNGERLMFKLKCKDFER